jgi:hypothetical protein
VAEINLSPNCGWVCTPIGYINTTTISHIAFVTGVSGSTPSITMDPAVWWAIPVGTREVWIWQHTEKFSATGVEIRVKNTPDQADHLAREMGFTV